MKKKQVDSVGQGRMNPIEDYYSYAEIALLCRRSVATIMSLVCRHRIPHISKAPGNTRRDRIALVPAEGVRRLRKLTLRIE